MHKLKIFFLVALILAPCFMLAQPKPKRDTSKDKVISVKKNPISKSGGNAQTDGKKKSSYRTTNKKKTPVVDSPKYASYITVDGSSKVLNKTFNHNSFKTSFTVRTDGSSWDVRNIPNWCQVTRYRDSFDLSCQANPDYDERNAQIIVTSDYERCDVNICQLGKPLNISANIKYIYLQHNFQTSVSDLSKPSGGYISAIEDHLKIRTNLNIIGAKGVKLAIVAQFFDEYNRPIKTNVNYPQNAFKDSGDLYAYTDVLPLSDSESMEVDILLPNNAMRLLNKKNKLTCNVSIFCYRNSEYIKGVSRNVPFKASNKKGKIRTKK